VDVTLIAIAGIIIFAAHFTKGFSGFGSALVALPLLVFFFDIKFALPVFLITDITASTIMCMKEERNFNWGILRAVVAGLLVGSIIGGILMGRTDSETLLKLFGIVVIAMALHIFLTRNMRVRIRRKGLWGLVTGMVSGTSHIMFGISGPPLVYYMSQISKDKQHLRATLYGIFYAANVFQLITYSMIGIMTARAIFFSLALIPFTLLGVLVGNRFFFKVDEERFREAITAIILVTGLLIVLR